MRAHLNEHAASSLQGQVPAAYCAQHGLEHCTVCGAVVSTRYNGVRPRCRPEARHVVLGASPHINGTTAPMPLSFHDVFCVHTPVLRHIPRVARGARAQCLARALAAVAGIIQQTPCWLAGWKASGLSCGRGLAGNELPPKTPEEALHSRCFALAAEGEFSQACAALADAPLLGPTPEVIAKLQAKHRLMVQLRLRLQVAGVDAPCPLSNATADTYGDHARVCPCGGDRAKRHHRLRTIVAARAQAAGLSPEVEKAGLLPPGLDDGGAPEDGTTRGGGQRMSMFPTGVFTALQPST
eukprot:Skav225733  [mRNA]  locus=scaffold611:119105:119992:+ [translate_table: standard]